MLGRLEKGEDSYTKNIHTHTHKSIFNIHNIWSVSTLTSIAELFMNLPVCQCVGQHSPVRKNKVVSIYAIVVSQKTLRLILELFRQNDSNTQGPNSYWHWQANVCNEVIAVKVDSSTEP